MKGLIRFIFIFLITGAIATTNLIGQEKIGGVNGLLEGKIDTLTFKVKFEKLDGYFWAQGRYDTTGVQYTSGQLPNIIIEYQMLNSAGTALVPVESTGVWFSFLDSNFLRNPETTFVHTMEFTPMWGANFRLRTSTGDSSRVIRANVQIYGK